MTQFKEPQFPAIFIDNPAQLRDFDRKLITVLGGLALNLKSILDRGISLKDNVDTAFISFTSSATPDAENTVPHNLKKIPTGFIVYDINKGAVVYKGSTTWTITNIFLKVNTATTIVKAWIF